MKFKDAILMTTCFFCLLVLVFTITNLLGQIENYLEFRSKQVNERLEKVERALDSVKEEAGMYGIYIDWKEESDE